jgi:ribonuclease BN (tRNA processing enzyme)
VNLAARILALALALVVVGVGWVATCVVWRAAEVGELVAPLEARRFSNLTLLAVGTGGAYENPERLGPSTGIGWQDSIALVDVGRAIAEALRLAKIPVHQPTRIFLTSLMPENTLGLDDLLFTGWRTSRDTSLQVIGPVGTNRFVRDLLRAYRAGGDALGTGLGLKAPGRSIEVEEAGDGWSAEWNGLRATARALPNGPTAALAWRFEAGGKSIVIGGTGWGTPTLVELARGADVLVHEAVYVPPPEDIEDAGVIADPDRLRNEAALHTSILDVGDLATQAQVGTLVLTRMRPPPFYDIQVSRVVRQSFAGTIVIPEDGDELTP